MQVKISHGSRGSDGGGCKMEKDLVAVMVMSLIDMTMAVVAVVVVEALVLIDMMTGRRWMSVDKKDKDRLSTLLPNGRLAYPLTHVLSFPLYFLLLPLPIPSTYPLSYLYPF